ncbi:MAG: hypothetical protein HFJ40_03885 [Clostridia bacterium]|nr:hypothetical protein [Clostridia bacterium]
MKDNNISRRQILIDNTLDLSVNVGKISEKVNYILYKEDAKENKKQKIEEAKEDIYNILENVENIAKSLEIDIRNR